MRCWYISFIWIWIQIDCYDREMWYRSAIWSFGIDEFDHRRERGEYFYRSIFEFCALSRLLLRNSNALFVQNWSVPIDCHVGIGILERKFIAVLFRRLMMCPVIGVIYCRMKNEWIKCRTRKEEEEEERWSVRNSSFFSSFTKHVYRLMSFVFVLVNSIDQGVSENECRLFERFSLLLLFFYYQLDLFVDQCLSSL